MVLRSDESANQAEVDRDQRFRRNVGKGIATASSFATAAAASPLASKIMPFINQYIPPGLAMQGISKVSPKLGSFLKKGQEMGLDVEEGLNFIKDKIGGGNTNAKEERNLVQQYSPELHQFIDQEIRGGRNAVQAGALAQNDKRFKNIITKITKDHKTPWSNILESIYGGSQPEQQPMQNQSQQSGNPQAKDQLLQAMQALSQQLRT